MTVFRTRFARCVFSAALVSLTCLSVYGQSAPEASAGGIASATTFNVRVYGAKGDGQTVDTGAIAKAIQAANTAGGGTVVFPPGKYLSGTFELLSNVTLDLEPGSIIAGSANVSDYRAIQDYGLGLKYGEDSSGEGTRVGIIVARKARNVAIVGRGTIDGNGDSFFDLAEPHNTPDFDSHYTRQGADFNDLKYGLENGPAQMKESGRPGTMIIFVDCRNVLLRDVTLSNAPNWTLHFQGSQSLVVSGLHIYNDLLLPNNDGIDCMRCRYAHFSDCDIHTGDDDFAIVSSDDIHVTNCTLESNSAAIRLEDTRWSTFENLSVHANRGLGIFGRDGGRTAHVLFSNITLETRLITGHWWGKAEPIYVAARSDDGPSEIRDVRFSNIAGEGESGIVVYGTERTIIRDLLFDRIKLRIRAPQERAARSVGGNFDLRWTAKSLRDAIFSHDIPALYANHFDGLKIREFELSWASDLPSYFSSAIECEDFKDLEIAGFDGRQAPVSKSAAAIALTRGSGVTIRDSRAAEGTGAFVSLSEVGQQRLFVNNDLTSARAAFSPSSSNQAFKQFSNNSPERQSDPKKK